MAELDLIYDAPPTLARFMKSDAFGRLVAGPVGSGKTTACAIECLRRAVMQNPGADGYRYTRFAVVRQTLKSLKDTVLRDLDTWFGARGLGYWKVSEGTYHLLFDDVRCELPFVPLEDASDQARLLSMQLTGAWLSECIEMDISILGPVSGRLGRYPSGARGQPTWHGWIADTNYPTEMTPWHQLMENPTPDIQIFKQPGGLERDAENINWLVQTDKTIKLPIDHPDRIAQGRRYYERFVSMYGPDHPWIQRYVNAQYGPDPSGMAVFKATFNRAFHVVPHTALIPGYPLIVGQDFGRNPWSLICQVDHTGRLLVHEEVGATNIGLERHVQENLKPRLMQDKYLGYKIAVVGDPAGVAKGSIAEESCFDALKRMGLPAIPAPTNNIEPRLRAVEALLSRHTNGGPSLAINAGGAPKLAMAMGGGYRFTKTKQGGLRVIPEKHDPEGYSHVADCLQYVCLCVHGGMMPYIMTTLRPKIKPTGPRISAAGWT